MSQEPSKNKEDVPVKEPKLTDAFQLGVRFEYVRTLSYFDVTIGEILTGLKDIEGQLEPLNLEQQYDRAIKGKRKEIEEEFSEEDNIEGLQGENLRTFLGKANTAIKRDFNSKNIVHTEERGLFNTKKALNNPESLFREEIWDWMSDTAQKDIKEACKCLAINCPTASMSMSLRAVEDCIRRWYKEETGNEIENTGWHTILEQLKNQFEEGSPEYLMTSMLDYQRGKRNSVSHPELTPNWRQANFILNTVQGTIAEIYQKMNQKSLEEENKESVANEIEEAIEEEKSKG